MAATLNTWRFPEGDIRDVEGEKLEQEALGNVISAEAERVLYQRKGHQG